MPDRFAVRQATEVLSAQSGLHGSPGRPLSAAIVRPAYLRYAGSRFTTPPTPDADRHDSGDDLDAWAAAIGDHPVWAVLDTRRASSLRVREDDAC